MNSGGESKFPNGELSKIRTVVRDRITPNLVSIFQICKIQLFGHIYHRFFNQKIAHIKQTVFEQGSMLVIKADFRFLKTEDFGEHEKVT